MIHLSLKPAKTWLKSILAVVTRQQSARVFKNSFVELRKKSFIFELNSTLLPTLVQPALKNLGFEIEAIY
jgi:hypothetical protein